MTINFDNLCENILETLEYGEVLGSTGPYDTSDARIPKVIGPIIRRKRKKVGRKKKST